MRYLYAAMKDECNLNVHTKKVTETSQPNPSKRSKIDFNDLLEKKAKENSMPPTCNDRNMVDEVERYLADFNLSMV